MATSINNVMLAGYLGKDPEVRTMHSGEKMAAFSLATTESWQDKNTKEWKKQTNWHRIAVYNPDSVDFCEKTLKKGSPALVHGKLNTRKYKDQQGADREITEIVVTKLSGLLASIPTKNKENNSESYDSGKEAFDDIPF